MFNDIKFMMEGVGDEAPHDHMAPKYKFEGPFIFLYDNRPLSIRFVSGNGQTRSDWQTHQSTRD